MVLAQNTSWFLQIRIGSILQVQRKISLNQCWRTRHRWITMKINNVFLFFNQVIQMLCTIEKSFDIFCFIFVWNRIAHDSFNSNLMIFLNHLWPKDTSFIHISTSLDVQDSRSSSFLNSYDVILSQWVSSDNNIGWLDIMEKEPTIEITIRSNNFSVNNKNFVRLLVFGPVEA